jgi:hypothetical protein
MTAEDFNHYFIPDPIRLQGIDLVERNRLFSLDCA